MVTLLLQHHANVNCMDLWKFTPLHEAAAKGKYEICKLLLKVGAREVLVGGASQPGPSLPQHGADVTRRNRENLTALDLVKEADGEIADLLRGDTALLDAAKKGDLDRTRKLITADNLNCRDEHGRNSTPLHLAGLPPPLPLLPPSPSPSLPLHPPTPRRSAPPPPPPPPLTLPLSPTPLQLATTTWTWWSSCWSEVPTSMPRTKEGSFLCTTPPLTE